MAQRHTKSWGTYLAINGKRDLKGRTLTDQQRLDLNPYHPIWDERANHTAQIIRHRIGEDDYQTFLEILPDMVDSWNPQQFCFAFDRALAAIELAPVGQLPGIVDLAVAALCGPISIHPYQMHKVKRTCAKCGASVSPYLIDPQGYLCRCDVCGTEWHFQDDAAIERWNEKIVQIKEQYFSHLIKDTPNTSIG